MKVVGTLSAFVLVFTLGVVFDAMSSIRGFAYQEGAVQANAATAPDAPKEPALSDTSKKRIVEALNARTLVLTQLENFQLKAQLANIELEKLTTQLQKVIAEETPKGYQINDKLELVKLAKP